MDEIENGLLGPDLAVRQLLRSLKPVPRHEAQAKALAHEAVVVLTAEEALEIAAMLVALANDVG